MPLLAPAEAIKHERNLGTKATRRKHADASQAERRAPVITPPRDDLCKGDPLSAPGVVVSKGGIMSSHRGGQFREHSPACLPLVTFGRALAASHTGGAASKGLSFSVHFSSFYLSFIVPFLLFLLLFFFLLLPLFLLLLLLLCLLLFLLLLCLLLLLLLHLLLLLLPLLLFLQFLILLFF